MTEKSSTSAEPESMDSGKPRSSSLLRVVDLVSIARAIVLKWPYLADADIVEFCDRGVRVWDPRSGDFFIAYRSLENVK